MACLQPFVLSPMLHVECLQLRLYHGMSEQCVRRTCARISIRHPPPAACRPPASCSSSLVSFVLIPKLRLFNRPFSDYLHPYCTIATVVTIEIAVRRVSRGLVEVAGRVTIIRDVSRERGTDVYAMLMQ
jgi:hypothetical protein